MGTKVIDMTGQKIGRLTVLSRVNRIGASQWNCICDCGKRCVKWGHNMRSGTVSCGCYRDENRHKTHDISGQRFGKLVAVSLVPRTPKTGISRWVCACDCGTVKAVRLDHLRKGRTISCGCAANKGPMIPFRSAHVRHETSVKDSIRRSRKGETETWYSIEDIERLLLKQKNRCVNCLGKITMETMHKDHRIALSKGGSNAISNIQLLCVPCNRKKYNKDPIEFARQNGRLL